MIITGVVISSKCSRIPFLLKRHDLNITDLFFKNSGTKGANAFLVRFQQKSYS